MMKHSYSLSFKSIFLCFTFILALFCSCEDEINKDLIINPVVHPEPNPDETELDLTIPLVDIFTFGTLQTYYLWCDEPGNKERYEAVLNPDTCLHPVQSLSLVLSPEDRWTRLMEKTTEFLDSTEGIETSVGMDVTPYRVSASNDKIFLVVNYVIDDSPAAKAGIKRGDIFTTYNNATLNVRNYQNYYKNKNEMVLGYGEIDASRHLVDLDKKVTLTPVVLKEEPILTKQVFDVNSKKVGYMVYNSFTEDVENLKQAATYFKEQEISELILDLRYNSGGHVTTCNSLCSILAPTENVANKDVLLKNVYNKTLTKVYENYITTSFDKTYEPYNLGLKKIYILTSQNTASASEMLIIGLLPYMDVTVIGDQTHGKFCSGLVLTPSDVFVKEYYEKYKEYFGDWGIYVMVGSFANSRDENPSRPEGYTPDYVVDDNPFEKYPLGSKKEALLSKALELVEGKSSTSTRASDVIPFKAMDYDRPSYSILDLDKSLLKKLNTIK